MICQVVGGVDETETDGEFRRCGFATRLPALAFQPRGVVGPAFPTLHIPHNSLSLAVGHTASVALATTMPFYQLVCIAAHYPEYVCLGPLHNFGTTC